jgi:ABC-type transport system involved in cytochrome c biogenesis permease subunit
MGIKHSVEGILIYCTMAAYLAAAVLFIVRHRRLGWVLYALGFAIVTAAFTYRWVRVKHVPMQNLFEVFLCLGVLMFPLSLFCLRFLRVGLLAADCVIGFIVLFPAGFVSRFSAAPQHLPPALQSGLFAPHVAAYMAAYVMMAKAAVQAFAQLVHRAGPGDERLVRYEVGAYRMVSVGFPLLTLGLILGSIWAKIAWGDYWNWDPKELWSFVSWLVYLGYLHFRYLYGRKYPKVSASLCLSGLVAIILTLLWVNLAPIFKGGLHSYAS